MTSPQVLIQAGRLFHPGSSSFKSWLHAYQAMTSDTEAPQKLHTASALFAIAGTLGGKCRLPLGHLNWAPNQYILMCAPPGVVQKSTTIGIAEKLMRDVGVRFGPSSGTIEAIIKHMAESYAQHPDDSPASQKRYGTSSLAMAISELGELLKADQSQRMVDVLVSLYDSKIGPWEHSTIIRGVTAIQSPCLSFAAATTPQWIRERVSMTMLDGGLFSRLITCWASRKRKLVAYPGLGVDAKPTGEYHRLNGMLRDDLSRIAEMRGEFRMTADAIAWGTHWYEERMRSYVEREHHEPTSQQGIDEMWIPSCDVDFEIKGERDQTKIHKIAMALSASESDSLIIEMRHLQAADAILAMYRSDLQELVNNFMRPQALKLTEQILSIIMKRERWNMSDLQRRLMREFTIFQIREILKALEEAGLIDVFAPTDSSVKIIRARDRIKGDVGGKVSNVVRE